MKIYLRRFFLLFAICPLLFAMLGCDAFVRKFTRKSKKEPKKEELVLVPEEYRPPPMTKEEVYRKYFLYWESWHDELINALTYGASQKKQLDCVKEALKNLELVRSALQEKQQKKLDVYIEQLKGLQQDISRDLYGSYSMDYRPRAERIKRVIKREFSYHKIKDCLA